MSASDYKICPAMTSAYIAKVSKKNPNLMTTDRREISENEILMLINWYCKSVRNCEDFEIHTGDNIIEIKYKINGKKEPDDE